MKPFFIEDIYDLFVEIQQKEIFDDQKTMTDAIPKYSIEEITNQYHQLGKVSKEKLGEFVLKYFEFPGNFSQTDENPTLPIDEHIENLWDKLNRYNPIAQGTLLSLPHPYTVPGGRFNEFFYWDSYFIMLGLQTSGRTEMMKNIIDNCAFLIDTYGFVPNASRTHFLSRSQPPYFSLMIQLYAETINDENVYLEYAKSMEKEYQFWMKGIEDLTTDFSCNKRVVRLSNGDILNRFYDEKNEPRPESYLIDVEEGKKSQQENFYQNIRAACESGWDFSCRWFSDGKNMETIDILNLITPDLNSLLYHLERSIAKASQLDNNKEKEEEFIQKSERRKEAIQKWLWNEEEGLYKDFHILDKKQTSSVHIGTLYPLFVEATDESSAQKVLSSVRSALLKDGGLITTTQDSGQQWDFPNAWAPFQYIGWIAALQNGQKDLAQEIAEKWCKNVERVYQNTGKLMEKYNAVNTQTIAGGGEYPNQDGFGWTNAVYIQFKNYLNQIN